MIVVAAVVIVIIIVSIIVVVNNKTPLWFYFYSCCLFDCDQLMGPTWGLDPGCMGCDGHHSCSCVYIHTMCVYTMRVCATQIPYGLLYSPCFADVDHTNAVSLRV